MVVDGRTPETPWWHWQAFAAAVGIVSFAWVLVVFIREVGR